MNTPRENHASPSETSTEHRELQVELFDHILEGAMAGYWQYEPATGAFSMSPSFKKMLGFDQHHIEDTVEGMRQLVHPEDVDQVDIELERLTETDVQGRYLHLDGEPYEMETRFYDRFGSTIWVWCRGRLIADADGSVRAVGCYVDVTAQKLVEADLVRSNDELQQFAYLTSHDLQEPLRTVTNFVEVLQTRYGDDLDEDGREYLDIVMQSTVRMQKLIGGILDYSGIGRGGAAAIVDLAAVVEEVEADLASAIDTAGAEVRISRLPKVIGYEYELRNLFANLLSNAVKFRRPDVRPLIEVEARRLNAGHWRFTVADNGIGIANHDQERIFEIFNRLHTRDEFAGAGIGLAHSRKIVELHGGSLSVRSELNVGSSFIFDLALG